MTDSGRGGQPSYVIREAIAFAVTVVLIALAVARLHGPAATLVLTGDSYPWIQHAHAAAHRPALLIADIDTFYRPSTTWSLVADRMLWGGFNATGYRVTSLVLHGIVAVGLAVSGRRLGLGPFATQAVALVWLVSPFTDESVFLVDQRAQPLLLLAWLVLIMAWPDADECWTPARVGVSIVVVLILAATKETWVVTPALVAAFEFDRRQSLRGAWRGITLVSLAVGVYLIAYVLIFPTTKSYYAIGPHTFAQIPNQLAAFLYLEEPKPFQLELTWTGLMAVTVVTAVVATCIRWRIRGVWFAFALLVVPTLPTLMVPYMPQRYLAIPYAGFVLLIALWISGLQRRMPGWQRPVGLAALSVAVLVVVAGAVLVRGDLHDYREIADAHLRLLNEADVVADAVLEGLPVVVVRDETEQPLVEILRDPRGLPKLPFTRPEAPYGLIDAAPLFEWVLADEGIRVEYVDTRPSGSPTVEGRVLVHRDGGFVDLGPVPNVAAEAARWRAAGRQLRVVRAVPLD